jgi:uncharacterized protein (DUF1697 family)
MNSQIALFRGINVGGSNILPMKELVAILQTIGVGHVQTYIQSGNAVLSDSKKQSNLTAQSISQEIYRIKGFEPTVLLLSSEQLENAVTQNPFPVDDGKVLHFFFLAQTPQQPDLARLDELKTQSESFVLHNDVFYLYAPDGIGRSKLAAGAEKALGVAVTARNYNTVNKLSGMLRSAN